MLCIMPKVRCITMYRVFCSDALIGIRNKRVSFWPIRTAGSWGYLTGRWREAYLYFVVILTILQIIEIKIFL